MAQIDLDRIELLRVQYESEFRHAIVNLRTAKIQLLQLLNDRTPVEQFDVTGPFDFSDDLKPLEDFRQIALDERPDLRAALEAISRRRPTTSWPSPTAPPIPPSAAGTPGTPPTTTQRPANPRSQRQHSPAHLRPQPGRKAAHPDRHRPQSAD